ncbi:MAG: hypothetical protein ACLTJ7_05575 [Clostridium sp.]
MKNKQQLIENPEKGSKRQNREMAVVTYLVMAIFFILAGYMVYFIIHDSDQVLNNSANKRQELLAKRVTKGKILSDKGNVLAKTVTDSSGNETRKYPYQVARCRTFFARENRVGGIRKLYDADLRTESFS